MTNIIRIIKSEFSQFLIILLIGLSLIVLSVRHINHQFDYANNCLKLGGVAITNYPDNYIFYRRCVKSQSLEDIPGILVDPNQNDQPM